MASRAHCSRNPHSNSGFASSRAALNFTVSPYQHAPHTLDHASRLAPDRARPGLGRDGHVRRGAFVCGGGKRKGGGHAPALLRRRSVPGGGWPTPPHPPSPFFSELLRPLSTPFLQSTAASILASTVKDAYDDLFTDACAACAGSGRLTCPHCDGSATQRSRPGDASARALALVSRGPRDAYRCQHCGPPAPYDFDFDHDIALDKAGIPYNADAADAFRENIHQALLGRQVLPVTFPPLAGTVRCGACRGSPMVRRHTPATGRLLPAAGMSPAVRAATLAGDLAPIQPGAFMDEQGLAGETWGRTLEGGGKGGAPSLPVARADRAALAAAGARAAEKATGARRGFFRRLVRGPGGQEPPPPRPFSYGEAPARPHTDKEVASASAAAWAGAEAVEQRAAAFPVDGAPPGLAPTASANDFVYPYLDDELAAASERARENAAALGGGGKEGEEEGEGATSPGGDGGDDATTSFKADLGDLPSGGRGKGRSSLLGGAPARGGRGRSGAREMEVDEGEGGGVDGEGPPPVEGADRSDEDSDGD